MKLLTDGLSLLYHEGRHVRFLIKGGYLPPTGWEKLVSLPRNRVDAWKELQSVRQAARSRSSAREAVEIFQKRFGRSVEDLDTLYGNPNWKDAKAVGGHAWRCVTAVVCNLRAAIEHSDQREIRRGSASLLAARHNTGPLQCKIVELDQAVGSTTDPWWHDEPPGA